MLSNEIWMLVLVNLEKIGIGAGLFLAAYLANMGLGAFNSTKLKGEAFNWQLIWKSVVKFAVVGVSLGLLSCVVSLIPAYSTYIGIEISQETMETIDGLVIIGSFLTATIRYVADSIAKIKAILGN